MTHAWTPLSPCGEACLPSPGSVATVGPVHRVARLITVAVALVVFASVLASLPLRSARSGQRALRRWFRFLLAVLRVRTEVSGDARFAPAGIGVLVVSNHLSWLDVLVLGAVQPLRMVCKSEVAGWRGVGSLARWAGALFIDRGRLSTLPDTVAAVAAALREGCAVGVFPEGTTYCGGTAGRFRPAAFQAALDAGALVRPVALQYKLSRDPTTVAAFVGGATLWRSVAAVATVRGLVVEVRMLPVLDAAGGRPTRTDRRAMAATADAVVRLAAPVLRQPVERERGAATSSDLAAVAS